MITSTDMIINYSFLLVKDCITAYVSLFSLLIYKNVQILKFAVFEMNRF